MCAVQKLCLFGVINDGAVMLSPIGELVETAWQDLPNHTNGLTLDAWVTMPNHLHGIIVLPGTEMVESDRAPSYPQLKRGSLGAVIGGFKSAVSREVNARNLTLVRPIWQRNYDERVIRNDRELDATRRYILDNPLRWVDDPDHPRFHHASPRL